MNRLLVVGTDTDLLKSVRSCLRDDFDIRHARTAASALRLAHEEQPDLIILGYIEPRGEAFNLNKELREREGTTAIPILVVDVHPKEHLRKGWRRLEGSQMDAEGYISRPLDARSLRAEVMRILDSASVRMLSWIRILEQSEKSLLQEMALWSGTEADQVRKAAERQVAELRI